jgi:hypothetical protein
MGLQDLMCQGVNQSLILAQQREVFFVKASCYVIGLQFWGREAIPATLFYVSSYCNEYTHHLPTNGIALQQNLFRIKIFPLSIALAYDKKQYHFNSEGF